MREQAKLRAERFAAREQAQDEHQGSYDLMDRLQQRSKRMVERADALQKLIAAAKPLYDSLDESQKHRFAELMRAGRRHPWRRED
jgi:hypothetical protein